MPESKRGPINYVNRTRVSRSNIQFSIKMGPSYKVAPTNQYQIISDISTVKLEVYNYGTSDGFGKGHHTDRTGKVEFAHDVALQIFEAALDSKMKLSKADTKRLMLKIIQSSALFDE